jgi:hypothetical protein
MRKGKEKKPRETTESSLDNSNGHLHIQSYTSTSTEKVGYQLLTSYHSIHTDFISSQLSGGQSQALTNGANFLSQV